MTSPSYYGLVNVRLTGVSISNPALSAYTDFIVNIIYGQTVYLTQDYTETHSFTMQYSTLTQTFNMVKDLTNETPQYEAHLLDATKTLIDP